MFDFLNKIQLEHIKKEPKASKPKEPKQSCKAREERCSLPPISESYLIPDQKMPEYEMPSGLELVMMLSRVGRPKPLCKHCRQEMKSYHLCEAMMKESNQHDTL